MTPAPVVTDEFAKAEGALVGLPFAKMTGSGNDFVVFDGRVVSAALVTAPHVVAAICNRHNGIGADGVVVLEPTDEGDAVRILYYNSDGSPADLCGNATLCSANLAVELGMTMAAAMRLITPAGVIASRIEQGLAEIDLQPVTIVRPDIAIPLAEGERRVGFAVTGIPHLVVLCEDADAVDVAGRGPILRRHVALGPAGANVNWVSPMPDGRWRYRTFERGVEGETLACGTGAIATGIVLSAWSMATSPVLIRTSSGRDLEVRFRREDIGHGATVDAAIRAAGAEAEAGAEAKQPVPGDIWYPSLRGEGRVVFRGRIGSLG